MSTYKIVRFYQNFPDEVIRTGLSFEEARTHCDNPETSSVTAICQAAKSRTAQYGPWFDGFESED